MRIVNKVHSNFMTERFAFSQEKIENKEFDLEWRRLK